MLEQNIFFNLILILFFFYDSFFQHAMRQLIDTGRYDTHSNFTVVLQPFMREVHLPRLEVRAATRKTFNLLTSYHPHYLSISRKGWSARSLVLLAWLFSSQPESSHSHGPCSLEQHGRIPVFVFWHNVHCLYYSYDDHWHWCSFS